MLPRGRLTEFTFYLIVLGFTAFLLWHSLDLALVIRGTVGPGLYPTLALGLLLIVTLVLIIRTLLAREVRVLSPFIEGLENDFLLRRVSRATGRLLGIDCRVVSRTGTGVFSVFHAARRAPADGSCLIAVSSETADLPDVEAAAFAQAHFEPVARLYFDPHVLIVRADAPWTNVPEFFAARPDEPMRIGFALHAELPAIAVDGIAAQAAFSIHPHYDEDVERMIDGLRAGTLDGIVATYAATREDRAAGDLRALGAMGEPGDVDGIPTFADQGFPILSGNWAGIFLPQPDSGAHENVSVADLHDGIVRGFEAEVSEDERRTQAERWRITEPSIFAGFLDRLVEQRRRMRGTSEIPALERGKVIGLVLAVLGLLVFPELMQQLGFPITAFLFLAGLMAILWPRLDIAALAQIVLAAAIVAYGLYYIFWNIFYVVFPRGELTGL